MDRKTERGYSMVELSITMAIIGVLAVMALPSMKDLIPRYQYRSALRTLTTNLNLTRLQAISRNREYKLFADTANDAYLVYEGNLPENSTSWMTKSRVKLPQGVDLYQVESLSGNSAIYRPDGTLDEHLEATPDGYGRIYVRGAGNTLTARIHIAAATGRLTVERYINNDWKDERYLKE